MNESDPIINGESEISLTTFKGDFQIKQEKDNDMLLSMPSNYLVQAESFFISVYRMAKDIDKEARSGEKNKISYLGDVMIAIGGVLIGIWNIVPVVIGFIIMILGFFLGRDARFTVINHLKGMARALVHSLETVIRDPKESQTMYLEDKMKR